MKSTVQDHFKLIDLNRFAEEIIGVQVKKEGLSYTYKNGILEVRIKK
jgi:HSP20 family molecular chaperone IbpA